MKRPPRQCNKLGCRNLVSGRYCAEHAHLDKPFGSVIDRPGAAVRGYDRRWQDARRRYLRSHPLCAECGRQGRATEATVVDHIRPHRGDQSLFWDEANWQPLCAECHNRKTALELAKGGGSQT